MTNLEAIETELLRRMLTDWELRLWFRENYHIPLLWSDHTRKCLCLLMAHCSSEWEIMEEAEDWGDEFDVAQWLTGLSYVPKLPESNAQLIDTHWRLVVPVVSRKLAEQYSKTQNPIIVALLASMPRHRPGRRLACQS